MSKFQQFYDRFMRGTPENSPALDHALGMLEKEKEEPVSEPKEPEQPKEPAQTEPEKPEPEKQAPKRSTFTTELADGRLIHHVSEEEGKNGKVWNHHINWALGDGADRDLVSFVNDENFNVIKINAINRSTVAEFFSHWAKKR